MGWVVETRGLPHVLESSRAGQGGQGPSLGTDRVAYRLRNAEGAERLGRWNPPLHSCPSRLWGAARVGGRGPETWAGRVDSVLSA